MPCKKLILSLSAGLLLSACASDPIDPLDPTQVSKEHQKPHCPIGYEAEYTTEIVVASSEADKELGDTTEKYRCVPSENN